MTHIKTIAIGIVSFIVGLVVLSYFGAQFWRIVLWILLLYGIGFLVRIVNFNKPPGASDAIILSYVVIALSIITIAISFAGVM